MNESYTYPMESERHQIERLHGENGRLRRVLRDILANEDAMAEARKSSMLGVPSEWQYERRAALRIEARTLVADPGTEEPEYEDPGPDPQPVDREWLDRITGTTTLPHRGTTDAPDPGTEEPRAEQK